MVAHVAELLLEVVREPGQHLAAVLGHEHEVLEPDAADRRVVAARLDRDDVAGDERAAGQQPHVRAFVHLEADAVPEAVEEPAVEHLAGRLRALGRIPGGLVHLAGSVEDRPAVDARADERRRRVERRLGQRVPLANLVRHRPGDDRAGHVGEAGGRIVARPEIEDDRVAEPDRAVAHLVAGRALRSRRDDEVLGRAAVLGEHAPHRRLDPLDRERLAVEPEHAIAVLRLPQQRDAGREARLGGALGAADAVELGAGLDPAARVEHRLIDRQLDAVAPQPVEVPGRETCSALRRASAPRGQRHGPPIRGGSRASRGPARTARRSRSPRAGARRCRARCRGSVAPPSSRRRRAGRRRARGRRRGREPRAAPRGGARASGTCRR